MEWEKISQDEQETIMNIDYSDKTITVYTSRKSVANRLEKKIGKPTKIYLNGDKIYAVEYKRNLFDKDVSKFFSKMLMIGAFREDSEKNED